MKPFRTIAFAGLLSLTSAVAAAPQVERLRGTIESADGNSITIRTIDGKQERVALADDTRFAFVVRSSLDAIKDGAFIGTATKGDNPPTALEVHIFPESMRGTGEGHRDWDMIPDTLAGGPQVKSAMTNGTVKSTSVPAPRVKSAMTNGTVSSNSGAGGEKMLTVTYDGNHSLRIAVPPRAPIVAYEPADRSILRQGEKVFLLAEKEGDKLTAKRVAVGKDGLTPPM